LILFFIILSLLHNSGAVPCVPLERERERRQKRMQGWIERGRGREEEGERGCVREGERGRERKREEE
jgi:hypothetical protein